MDVVATIAKILQQAEQPLAIPEIVELSGVDTRDVDRILWNRPDLFVWQPGHRWSASSTKSRPGAGGPTPTDTRSQPLVPGNPKELRAITLASGLTLRVQRRPLDSDAFFSVRSAGNTVELIINSSHELFGSFPMPFEVAGVSPHQELLELMLEAWALYEDGLPGGSSRRALEDLRLLWGRRAIEILRDRE